MLQSLDGAREKEAVRFSREEDTVQLLRFEHDNPDPGEDEQDMMEKSSMDANIDDEEENTEGDTPLSSSVDSYNLEV